MSFDQLSYPRPEAAQIHVVKEPVAGAVCPSCGSTDVRRYPIAWYCGPRIVVKCQDCFTSLSVERPVPADMWPPFRSVAYDWDVSSAERPGRLTAGPDTAARS